MTSGNNVIPALTGASPVQTGTGQFGINLRANSAPQGGQDVSGTGFGLPTASPIRLTNLPLILATPLP